MKRVCLLLSSFSLLLFNTGCQKKPPASPDKDKPCCMQKVTINVGAEPGTLDPRKARSLADINMIKMFMEGLSRVSQDGKAHLALAESVDVSEDQLTYTFHLRDANWSNGDPILASDFTYAWKKALSPDFPSDNAFNLYPIKNAKSIKSGKLPVSFLGAKAVDERTLVVNLESPTPYFLKLTTMPIYFPINAREDKVNPMWASNVDSFVGSGPFLPSSWRHHDKLVAKKNAAYWDEKEVKLSEIEMVMVNEDTGTKLFETGDVQWQGSPFSLIPIDSIEGLKSEQKLKTHPFLGTFWVRLNIEKAPLDNSNLRKALAYAIDRSSIVTHITQGGQLPASGIVPSSMGLSATPYFADNDQDAARAHLTKALDEMGVEATSLPPITLTYNNTDRSHRIAQALQYAWKETLGIEVNLERVERNVYFSRVSHQDYAMATGSWIADFNDPINFLEVFQTKDNGTNNTNWESEKYQSLLAQSYFAKNSHDRAKLLKECESIIMDEMPVIPIFSFTMLYAQDESVQNVVLTDLGNIDFKTAFVAP